MLERKNVNRGFKKLRVWQDATSLYVLVCKVFSKFPYTLNRVAANSMDPAHSIGRNISEGYFRRSLREYLNFLNFALGSCGEFHSSDESYYRAGQINKENYEEIEALHYKVENELLRLIGTLQKKAKMDNWEDNFNG
jgi:four helix bundle protein